MNRKAENGKNLKNQPENSFPIKFLFLSVALMVQDFRDMCQGTHQSLNGITAFNLQLLAKADYHVIGVPYSEFSISDKLLKRVQYLEKVIKEISKN